MYGDDILILPLNHVLEVYSYSDAILKHARYKFGNIPMRFAK